MTNIGTDWTQVDYWQSPQYDTYFQETYYCQVRLVAKVTQSITNNSDRVDFKWQKRLSAWKTGRSAYNNNTYSWSITTSGHSATMSFALGTVNSTTWTDVGSSDYWANVGHNADGTLTVSAKAKGYRFDGTSFSTTESLTFPTIPRASKPTYSTNPLTIGQTQTITTNRASSSFTHTLVLSFGNYSETLTGVGASTTWTPSSSLMEYMTSWQMTVTVVCTTYNGSTQIGTSSTSFTLQVDTSVYKPVITVGTLSDANASTAGLTSGTFIKGKSILSGSITATPNDSGDSIASITARLGNTTQTVQGGDTGEAVSFLFQAATTTNELIITATDQRGYTVTKSVSITLLEYSNISVISVDYARVNANNVETETGEYVRYTIKANAFLGSFGAVTNQITVSSQSKLASASVYGSSVTEKTVTTSGTGMGEITITGVTVGTYSPSSQYDILFTLTDALSSATAQPLRVHEGVPVAAWGEDHFDIYGEFHVHDRDDVTKYTTIYPNGYRWNLIGTASGTTPVTFDGSNYSEIMLVSKYYENANNNWIATAIIPVAELVSTGLVVMMPARIYSSTQNDKGCLVRITTTSANVDEWYSNRTSVKTSATLAVYMR